MDDPGVLEGDSDKEIIEKIKKFFRVNHRRGFRDEEVWGAVWMNAKKDVGNAVEFLKVNPVWGYPL